MNLKNNNSKFPILTQEEFRVISKSTDKEMAEFTSKRYKSKYVWVINYDIQESEVFCNFDFEFSPAYIEKSRLHIFGYENSKIWIAKLVPSNWKEINSYVIHTHKQYRSLSYVNPCLNLLTDDFAEYLPAEYDLKYTHVWRFDPATTGGKEIDAVRINYTTAPEGYKIVGTVKNKYTVTHNPKLPETTYIDLPDLESIDYSSGKYELVLNLDYIKMPSYKVWAIKLTPPCKPIGIKNIGKATSPDLLSNLSWQHNDNIVPEEFSNFDYAFTPVADELMYEHIWYIENTLVRYGENTWGIKNEKTWAIKYGPVNPIGTRDMGTIPASYLRVNPDIVSCELQGFNFDSIKDTTDDYERVWFLDPAVTKTTDNIWAIKFGSGTPLSMGYVNPIFTRQVILNGDYKLWDWDNAIADFNPAYDQLWFDHVWLKAKTARIWGAKIKFTDRPRGTIYHGYVEPTMPSWPTSRTEGKDFFWTISESLAYDEYWNQSFMPSIGNEDKVHVFGLRNPRGEFIDYGGCYLIPTTRALTNRDVLNAVKVASSGVVEQDYDVVFISNGEPYADIHYAELLKIVPTAKRVDRVKGIAAAHKAAAAIATSPLMFVVDADCKILDPSVFLHHVMWAERNTVHVWKSRNPVNGLEYGYGAVKLFNRQALLDSTMWTVDFSTTFNSKFKVHNRLVCETAFNFNEETTWRSAFRECAKLAAKIIPNQVDHDTAHRLHVWKTQGADSAFGVWAQKGAEAGAAWAIANPDLLHYLNDYDWLRRIFQEEYVL